MYLKNYEKKFEVKNIGKIYKLKFIIKGKETEKEFDMPDMNLEVDMQTSLDLLAIQAKAEKHFKDLKPEKQQDEEGKDTGEYMQYRNFVATQFNLDATYYLLHKIDDTVTFEMVNSLGKQIRKFIDDVFSTEKKQDKDFQRATKKKQVAN